MDTNASPHLDAQTDQELGQIIEIRDPEIDVEEIMAQIRANVARRRAEGAYKKDLDAIADEVFASLEQARGVSVGEGLSSTLAEMNTQWVIREQPFTSNVPVIGRLIVAVRTFWNWMSTKWYVRSLFQQQMNFNALTVRALNELYAKQQALQDEVQRLRVLSDAQAKELEDLYRQLRRREPRR